MYAPVSSVTLEQDGDRLVGYAAPGGGRRPCLLALDVDGRPISVARATRYSQIAAQQRLRRGWCGVEVIGLSAAAALGRRLTVRCGVSGNVVWHHRVRGPISPPASVDQPLSVFEIVRLSQAVDCADSIERIEPFITAHLRRHGPASFVEAAYRTFLGRTPEGDLLDRVGELAIDDVAKAYPASVLGAKEFANRPFKTIPGPFNHAFGYDLSPLEDH